MSRNAKPKRQRKGKGQGKRKGPRKGKAQRTDRGARRSAPRRRKAATTRQKPRRSRRRPTSDPRLEAAVLEMNRGRSLTAAAKALRISPKRLKESLRQRRIGKRKGRRWVATDQRRRKVSIITAGRLRTLSVIGYQPARLAGEHHSAVGRFVRTNDMDVLEPFKGKSVRAANGRKYPLETDPNALHRIAAMESPPFHEIYAITSKS